MRKVHLHGALAEKYGPSFNLEVSTAAEAVRALAANFSSFLKDLRDGAWHIVRGSEIDSGFSLGEKEISSFKLGKGDLHFVPAVVGSKRGGLLKIVLGVVLIGAAFMFSGGALAAPIAGGALGGVTYGNMAMIGAAVALAGVSSLLSPEEASDEDKQNSFTFSGPGNTYDQGAPIPLVYGEIITGAVMVSGGLDIEKIKVGS